MYTCSNPVFAATSASVKASLAKIGITVAITVFDEPAYVTAGGLGAPFDIAGPIGWVPGLPGPLRHV